MAGFHLDDTIAAVSTAMAPAGIGIVRISGNDAFEVADRVFREKKEGKKLSAVKSHTIHYGWITEGEEVIDEVLVMVMKGPKTYTGENTVEIDCHGGVLAVKKVLEADTIKWNLVTDSAGQGTSMLELYNVNALPRCFLIDNEGKIILKTDNGLEVKKVLEQILKK